MNGLARKAGIVAILIAQWALLLAWAASIISAPLFWSDATFPIAAAAFGFVILGSRCASLLVSDEGSLRVMRRCAMTAYALSSSLSALVLFAVVAMMSDGGPSWTLQELWVAAVIFAPLLALIAGLSAMGGSWGVFYAECEGRLTGERRSSRKLMLPFVGAWRFFKEFDGRVNVRRQACATDRRADKESGPMG